MLALTDLTVRFPDSKNQNSERILRKMIELAFYDGIRALCCVSRLPYNAKREDLRDPKDLLVYAEEYPELRLLTAAELHFEGEDDARALSSDPPTLGHSDILLISLDTGMAAEPLFRTLMLLRESGHGILLHEPDAIACLQKQPSLALRLSELGILFQISAGSVLGENGLARKRFCTKMLKENRVFTVVSDATDHLYRPPRLSRCWKRIRRSYGDELAYRLFSYNPSRVLGLAAPLD